MVSMKDIAERLNLSRTTVSNILNNKLDNRSYKKETIDLVIETAKEMGYITNNIAKSLKTGTTKTIAVVVPDIANTFYVKIIKEIELLASQVDYSLIICIAEERVEKEEKALKMLRSRMVDGVIIAPVSFSKSLLGEYSFKIVCFDRTVDGNRFPSVLIDNESAAYNLTHKIIKSSVRGPLFLAGSEFDYTVKCRLNGYKKALIDNGISFKDENVIYGIYDEITAYDKMNNFIMNNGKVFDSLILSTNYFIYGVLRSLYENNINLISIGGFEDFIGSKLINANILYVDQPEKEIAKVAFDKLWRLLHDEHGEDVTNSILKTKINYSSTKINFG